MCCPGGYPPVRLTQLAGTSMASRLHHLEKVSGVCEQACTEEAIILEAGVVSESVKCPNVKSRDQTWTCRH